ncbi:hypothetical protein [Rhodoblastus acidophilus]|nr:hypothetical protein [Rhodoblastus acidophilus]
MTKKEAEPAIRRLCHDWAQETGFSVSSGEMPSFLAFKEWLNSKGYGHYLRFKSLCGPDADAERWFDDELGQNWRN